MQRFTNNTEMLLQNSVRHIPEHR